MTDENTPTPPEQPMKCGFIRAKRDPNRPPRTPRPEPTLEEQAASEERRRLRDEARIRESTDITRFVTAERPFPTIGWSGGTEAHDVTGRYRLCTTCGGLKADECGMAHWAHDQCSCDGWSEDETISDAENRMPCMLCRACGLQITRGHHRWRLLVCYPCRSRLATFNGQVGRKVLPQGIHSLVNGGPLLQVAQRPTKEQFEDFASGLNAMFAGITGFHDWGNKLVLDRLRLFGFERGQLIPVEDYLDACRAAGIDQSTGWQLLEQRWFADS